MTVGSSAISLVNAGLEDFGRAAQLELTRGERINTLSRVEPVARQRTNA